MRFWAVLILGIGCAPTVSRDRAAYTAELNFINRVIREGAPANHDVVVNGCTCTGAGLWRAGSLWMTDAQCAHHAEWWVVYTARWDWHHRMMLFNAGLTQTRPGLPAVIPPVTCTLPTVRP
jgi:hypothetical protein